MKARGLLNAPLQFRLHSGNPFIVSNFTLILNNDNVGQIGAADANLCYVKCTNYNTKIRFLTPIFRWSGLPDSDDGQSLFVMARRQHEYRLKAMRGNGETEMVKGWRWRIKKGSRRSWVKTRGVWAILTQDLAVDR